MKADPKIIEMLQEVLKAELTAINQYFLHAEMCENWGYQALAKHTRKESIEEMHHAEVLMERILYFDGTPTMSELFKINVGANVEQQMKNDLELEYAAVKRLNGFVQKCTELNDAGTRELFKINVGPNVEQQMKNDLELEYAAVKRLNGFVQKCTELNDAGTRELFEHILTDEEEHIDYLEGQLHAVSEMGIANYLAQQLKGED